MEQILALPQSNSYFIFLYGIGLQLSSQGEPMLSWLFPLSHAVSFTPLLRVFPSKSHVRNCQTQSKTVVTSSICSFIITFYYFLFSCLLLSTGCSCTFFTLEIKDGNQDHALGKAVLGNEAGMQGE